MLLGPLGAAFAAASLAKNPWHVARTRASMTGAVLADAIVRADLRSVVLVGFSLGARVMAAAAESLATRHEEPPRIESMHLLGAAVGTRRDWHSIEAAVDGRIYNYCSTNDKILRALYRAGEAGTKAIGCEGIPTKSRKVKNVNVSRQVRAHQDHLNRHTSLSDDLGICPDHALVGGAAHGSRRAPRRRYGELSQLMRAAR